ncbi:MAG: LacI family transcriptional regulator [Saprospiraceae bacterium]|nr:LacI family transcriptional regulator [Saprospiraceae bacterium]
MGRITIKDIARLLDVNPSTVSRALKNHPDISEPTRLHIQKVAQELGYTPNYQAIGLRNQKSKLLGLIIPEMNMFFFPSIIRAIEETIRQKGYNLIVLHSNNRLASEIENVKICQKFGVEGVMASLTADTQHLNHFQDLEKQGIPVVFFDRVLEHPTSPVVMIDDIATVQIAIDHLAESGRKSICGFFGNEKLTISKKRFEGFKQALAKYNMELPDHFIRFANNAAQAKAAMIAILDYDEKPDAIFSMSDELLVGIMQAVQKREVKIPEELGIVSISNGDFPNFFKPSITYIEHSAAKVGSAAANLLFEVLENPQKQTVSKYIKTRLRVRGST